MIARLENRDVAAQREQAAAQVQAARANLAQGEAELEDAQASLKRAQDLARQNFISGSALDTAEARYSKARAQIDTLKAQIGVAEANLRVASVGYDQTLIRAPFSGIVLTKSANVGDIVTPFSAASGTTGAVVTMADMETLEVEADVSESSIAKIAVGQPAEIQLDAFPELRLLGEVSRVVPTVDRSKATLLVKVKFVERDRARSSGHEREGGVPVARTDCRLNARRFLRCDPRRSSSATVLMSCSWSMRPGRPARCPSRPVTRWATSDASRAWRPERAWSPRHPSGWPPGRGSKRRRSEGLFMPMAGVFPQGWAEMRRLLCRAACKGDPPFAAPPFAHPSALRPNASPAIGMSRP